MITVGTHPPPAGSNALRRAGPTPSLKKRRGELNSDSASGEFGIITQSLQLGEETMQLNA
ncbi:MAG: hypothetical protein Q8K98_08955 [Bacteroidota bacterium]|nr:hypothetical protein [Bacteroidota bacterium]